MSSSTTSTYQTLPDDIGTQTNPIRLPLNVVRFHIKKTADKKDFVLGNTIVTNRYASSMCMITNIVPNDNQSDTLKVILHDGTYDLRYSIISKSLIPPETWAKLCDCSLDDANNWIKDSATSTSDLFSQSLSQYQASSNYPIIVEFVFQLDIEDGHANPNCTWYSGKLFDDYPVAEKKITQQSEEWYNIIWKENIEKGAAFYKDYCLTSSQKLSLQTNTFHPPYGYHSIFDNPCYPIPMTCANMWDDTKPTTQPQQDGKQRPKLFYHGKDIKNRLVYITVHVAYNTTCPKTPQCSAYCKYVEFKDNSIGGIFSHLTKDPSEDSTCIRFFRLNAVLGDDKATISANGVLSSTIGKEGYKNQTLIDEHQAKALQVIEEIKAIDIKTKEYTMSLRLRYNKYIEQVKHSYSLITSRLSSHPLFSTLIEPLQQQLEDVMKQSKEEQFDTAEQLNDVSDWYSTISDLLSQCKQILDTLLNTNIALYNDFYEYYLPHLDEQLHHLQQQMELSLLSHHNTATIQSTSNNNHNNNIIINNTTNTNNLLPFTFSYQLNRLNNYYLCSANSTASSSYYHRRPHIAPPCEYVVSAALQSLIHQQQQEHQQQQHNTTTSLSTMTDDDEEDDDDDDDGDDYYDDDDDDDDDDDSHETKYYQHHNSILHNSINNINNTINQYHYNLLTRHLTLISQNLINMNAEKEAAGYQFVEQHQAIIKEKDNIILDNKIALQQQQTIIQAKDQHISQLTYQKLTLTKDHQNQMTTTKQQYENEIATTKHQYETQIAVSKQTTESLVEQITFLKQQLARKDDQLATKDKQIESLLTKH